MSGLSAPLAPPGVGGNAAGPSPQSRPHWARLAADAAVGLALLLALGIVFALDLSAPDKSDALARKYESASTIFDPLAAPLAAVRENPNRQRWIGAFGGSDTSEEAVRLGLQWLARHQAKDGHWGPDCLQLAPDGRCRGPHACTEAGSCHRIAQTGLAILALQAAGHYDFNENEYSRCVRRGLDWLITNQRADGRLLDQTPGAVLSDMYEHGIAAFALADGCEMAVSLGRWPEDRFGQAAQRAIQFIGYAQHDDGGWRYSDQRELPSDTSVSGWQVLALNAARRAKIVALDPDCVARVEGFFKSCELGESGRTGYQPGHALSDATTGVGMLVHEFLLERPDAPLVRAGAQYLAGQAEQLGKAPRGRKRRAAVDAENFYALYNCTLAMFQAGGEPWKRWNNIVRDRVIGLQCRDAESCENGSWDAHGQWSPQGGRVYSTALAVLTLEVYYRYTSRAAQVYKE